MSLRYDSPTKIEARGPHKVLITGLGALGVGRMWVEETPSHRDSASYALAPYEPLRKDDFGDTA